VSRYLQTFDIDLGHADELSLFAVVIVFKSVLPSVLRCTTPVLGWLIGGYAAVGPAVLVPQAPGSIRWFSFSVCFNRQECAVAHRAPLRSHSKLMTHRAKRPLY